MSLTETLGFLTGAVCVWLAVRQNIWNWPIGIANNIFYLVVFFKAKLYADAGLQIVYVAISAYGWWSWLRGGEQRSELTVTRLRLLHGIYIGVATAISAVGLTWILRSFTDSTVPMLDAVTTALSLAAQYMISRKILENWTVWIIADVIYIGLYAYKSLYLTSLLYLVFLVMCVFGHIRWHYELEQPALLEPIEAAAE
jgi:nicotinamide mononucleotide transporter